MHATVAHIIGVLSVGCNVDIGPSISCDDQPWRGSVVSIREYQATKAAGAWHDGKRLPKHADQFHIPMRTFLYFLTLGQILGTNGWNLTRRREGGRERGQCLTHKYCTCKLRFPQKVIFPDFSDRLPYAIDSNPGLFHHIRTYPLFE